MDWMWWINGVAPKSPDLIPTDFLLWAYVKDRVYVPPMPVTLNELKQGICRAVESISIQVLQDLWMELQYRLDVCKHTSGAYIEQLYVVKETLDYRSLYEYLDAVSARLFRHVFSKC
jgi:hypothetical protein